jgi:predicted MFS family arabinose efflux permease
MFAMAVNWVPPERRGDANATVFAALDVGIGGGSYLLGALAQSTGSYAAMYLAAGLGLVVPAVLFSLKVIPDYIRSSL